MKKTAFFIVTLMFLFPAVYKSIAQELKATVVINMEQLEADKRFNVQSMERDISNYVNNQRYLKTEWEGEPIPVDINIYLSGGGNGIYQARLMIGSKRYIDNSEGGSSIAFMMVDNEWKFPYAQGAALSYNPLRFDEFTSLLDYYMLVCIGMDMDTYGELEGTPAFEVAKQIVQLGSSRGSSGYKTFTAPGEFSRYSLVSELTDLRYEEFRKMIFAYYVDGLDLMMKNKETALDNMVKIINDMAVFKEKKMAGPSVLLSAFFESKARELAAIFKGYNKNPQVFKNLKYIDPSNTMLYDDAENNR